MIVIIPVHNQVRNIRLVLNAYLEQTVLPSDVILVFDRCTDKSREMAERMVFNFEVHGVRLHMYDTADWGDGNGFGAGRTRDLGLSVAMQLSPNGPYLFTDGDCVPGPMLVESHLGQLNVDQPRITCGRRYDTLGPDEKPNFDMVLPDAQDDLRNAADYTKGLVCMKGRDRLVFNPAVFESSWICWSCNLGLNRAAIDLCRSVNGILTGDIGRVFNSMFDGRWGGEDGFVGLTMFRCGGETVMLSERAWVKHIWHPRSHTNLDHLRLVQRMDYELQRSIFENRIPTASYTTIATGAILDRRDLDSYAVWMTAEIDLSASCMNLFNAAGKSNLLKTMIAICCSGYLKRTSSSGPYLFREPRNTPDREMLDAYVSFLQDSLYHVPFAVNQNQVVVGDPVDLDIVY